MAYPPTIDGHGTQINKSHHNLDPSSTASRIRPPRPPRLRPRRSHPSPSSTPQSTRPHHPYRLSRPPRRRFPPQLDSRHIRHNVAPLPQPEHPPLYLIRQVAPGPRPRLHLRHQHSLAPPTRLPRARSQEPCDYIQHQLSLRLEDGGAPLSPPTPNS